MVGRQEQGERDRLRRVTTSLEICPARNRRWAIETSRETQEGGGKRAERMSKRSQWRGKRSKTKKSRRKLVEEERTKLGSFARREGAPVARNHLKSPRYTEYTVRRECLCPLKELQIRNKQTVAKSKIIIRHARLRRPRQKNQPRVPSYT